MKTIYHCKKCNVRFEDESTPNMNTRHSGCGEFMTIERHDSEDKEESK